MTTVETRASTTLVIPARTIELFEGEHDAGDVLKEDGTLSHRLILLDGDYDGHDWNGFMALAKEKGADLPSPQEQALLFANLKKHFKPAWYWSNTQYSGGYAYSQYFHYGTQLSYGKSWKGGRVRLVRRVFA